MLYRQQTQLHHQQNLQEEGNHGEQAAPDNDLGGKLFVCPHFAGHNGAGHRCRRAKQSQQRRILIDTAIENSQIAEILYVSRGSYRNGSVAMISPYDGEMLLTREIKVIRFLQENNKYGITPEYLCYAMSHRLVWEQTKTKVFYEPCLPNIAGRWLDIEVPIFEDTEKFEEIKCRASSVFKKLWAAKETIQDLRENADAYLI